MIKLPNSMKFRTRFKIRVIFDNIFNFAVLLFGIYLASLLFVFGTSLMPIIDNYEEEVLSSLKMEYQYILKSPIELEAYKLTQYKLKSYYKLADRDIDITFYGLDEPGKYFEGLNLKKNTEGIIISSAFANKFEYKIGDKIKFNDDILEKEYEFEIIDIYPYKSSISVFMDRESLNKIIDMPSEYFNTYFSDKELDIDSKYIKQKITREDMGNIGKQMLSSFKDILVLVNVFAVVIYLILMYVLTKVIIEKNSLQISLLKVLGYGKNEIKRLYLKATSIAVVIIMFVVQPLEGLTMQGLVKIVMIKIDGYFEGVVPIHIYALTIATGILSYFVINKIQVKKIDKIPLEDILKERE